MGFTFRKSVKIGKNTRVNFSSKGGVGISTGVKGARVSVNKKGTRVSLNNGPVHYQKQFSNNKIKNTSNSKCENYDYEKVVTTKNKLGKIKSFLKKHYKSLIIIFIGFFIGGSIGSIGRVSSTLSEQIIYEINRSVNENENKKSQIENLKDKKHNLELDN